MCSRDWRSHAVEYDICGGRFRLLPPLPFDALSLLKMLNYANGDIETVLTLQSFENKMSPSKDNELKFPDLRSSARSGICVTPDVPNAKVHLCDTAAVRGF